MKGICAGSRRDACVWVAWSLREGIGRGGGGGCNGWIVVLTAGEESYLDVGTLGGCMRVGGEINVGVALMGGEESCLVSWWTDWLAGFALLAG